MAKQTPSSSTCSNCPLFELIKEDSPSNGYGYGKCHRTVLSIINPNNLTPHGPHGNFAIMNLSDWCGEHPQIKKQLYSASSPQSTLPNKKS